MCLSEIDSKMLTLCCAHLFPRLAQKPAQQDEPEADTHVPLQAHTPRECHLCELLPPNTSVLSVTMEQNTQENCFSIFPPLKMQNNRSQSQVLYNKNGYEERKLLPFILP